VSEHGASPPYDPADWEATRRAVEEQRAFEETQGYYDPIKPQRGLRALLKKLAAPAVFLAVLLWKFKFVLAAVFKLKIFTTAGSMLVSIGAYALLFGWKFGVGLVLLIFVHELGHVLELRRQGVPASAPMFIPFVGAFVAMKELPQDAWREARVALAGPLLGTVGAVGVWIAAVAYDSTFLMAMAFVGFFLNLFNLLPVVPLDGGRAVAALHPAIWGIGVAGLAVLTWLRPNPILLIVVVLGGLELWHRWQSRHDAAAQGYYRVKPWQRVAVGAVYLGLAAFLGFAIYETHVPRSF
jgi:Zn-dependent protease